MVELMEMYEKYKGSRPMDMKVEHIKGSIPRWRIHIFERGTAPTGGDRELVCAEDRNKELCIQKAIKMMECRMKWEIGG